MEYTLKQLKDLIKYTDSDGKEWTRDAICDVLRAHTPIETVKVNLQDNDIEMLAVEIIEMSEDEIIERLADEIIKSLKEE